MRGFMDVYDERELRKRRWERRKGQEKRFLEEHFEDPDDSDILMEKQVKEGKRKK